MLTPLQRQIVDLIRELPEAEGVVLAGGAALIVRGLVVRETHDLDYFATRDEAVHRLAPVLERRLLDPGVSVERIQDSPSFVRLQVSSEDEECEVDLAHDARLWEPQITYAGPVLADEESPLTRCSHCSAGPQAVTLPTSTPSWITSTRAS